MSEKKSALGLESNGQLPEAFQWQLQLLQWRPLFRTEQIWATKQLIGFVPAVVVPQSEPVLPAPAGPVGSGAIEIELASGTRMRITDAVDATTLRAVVAALTGEQAR